MENMAVKTRVFHTDACYSKFDWCLSELVEISSQYRKQEFFEKCGTCHHRALPTLVEVYINYIRDKVESPRNRNSFELFRGAGYQLVHA
jgi:hypothetical protein